MSDIELDLRWIEYKMEQYKEKESQIMNDKSVVEAQNKNELKCPFCQQRLHKDSDGYYTCYTDNCGCWANGGNGASGSESLWLTLIRTRKALDVAKEGLKEIQDKGEYVNPIELAESYLDEITALEQKDVK